MSVVTARSILTLFISQVEPGCVRCRTQAKALFVCHRSPHPTRSRKCENCWLNAQGCVFDDTIQYKAVEPADETALSICARNPSRSKASEGAAKVERSVHIACKTTGVSKKTLRAQSTTSDQCIDVTPAKASEVAESTDRRTSVPSMGPPIIKSAGEKGSSHNVQPDNDSAGPLKQTRSGMPSYYHTVFAR